MNVTVLSIPLMLLFNVKIVQSQRVRISNINIHLELYEISN